jgi:hypothetical protein
MNCKLCGKLNDWGKFAEENEKKSGVCPNCMDKSFKITGVARADLLDSVRPEDISKFDDATMEHLASKMANAYVDNSFWIDLKILSEYELEVR